MLRRSNYVLCGTNNVDQILGVQKENYSNFVVNHHASDKLLDDTKHDIQNLIEYVHQWAQSASINVINILPRVSACRNFIINQLNQFIRYLSDNRSYINMVGTESHRSLFSFTSGNRKDNFFSSNGTDNVHLTHDGVVRLAKYLKFFAHQ